MNIPLHSEHLLVPIIHIIYHTFCNTIKHSNLSVKKYHNAIYYCFPYKILNWHVICNYWWKMELFIYVTFTTYVLALFIICLWFSGKCNASNKIYVLLKCIFTVFTWITWALTEGNREMRLFCFSFWKFIHVGIHI